MAEIEVRRKSSFAWLWWVLLAVLLGGLLWWILGDGRERSRDEPATATERAAGTAATGEPIADVLVITEAPNAQAVRGREVRLQNVPVLEVVSDAGFWVGSGEQRAFVVLNEVATPGTPVEGLRNIEPGQQVTIAGTLRTAADAAPTGTNIPTGVDRYIVPSSVEILGTR